MNITDDAEVQDADVGGDGVDRNNPDRYEDTDDSSGGMVQP